MYLIRSNNSIAKIDDCCCVGWCESHWVTSCMVFIMVRTNTVANYEYSTTAAGIFTTTTLRSVQYYCT